MASRSRRRSGTVRDDSIIEVPQRAVAIYFGPMAKVQQKGSAPKKGKEKYPWLLLLLFLASVYIFWILPYQLGPRPVRVEFAERPSK